MEELRTRILNSATNRFFEYGITKVTLDEIAADCGISKKTLYKYFRGKDSLLEAAIQSMEAHIRLKFDEISASDRKFEEKLSMILLVVGKQMSKIRPLFLQDLQRFHPALWKKIDQFRSEIIVRYWKPLFHQAQEEGVFHPSVPVELFYLVFVSAVQGVINPKVLTDHSFSAVDAMRGLLIILLEGAVTAKSKRTIQKFLESLDHYMVELEV